ncbi:hypothetical protein ABES80_23095 [Bacillus gobiensis]|uniref:hypothetical protein n=1 Tax=Bacillus gobiensis TaxID=1441095 RepID=UPI003D190AEC
MKKISKYLILLLLIIFSVRGIILSIEYEFHGNSKKIKESEEIMISHLDSKGYGRGDILAIKGIYNFTAPGGRKYGGSFVLKDTLEYYEYELHNGKVFELDDIPEK